MKVEWAGPAILDVRAIKAYISRDSEAYANRFAERIIEAAESLQTLPLRGRTVPEANSESVRELLFGSYRIVYRVGAGAVEILTVFHAARLLRLE